MSQIKKGDSVKFHYTGRIKDGEIIDSSAGKEPLSVKIGEGQLIVGMEEALMQMTVGEKKIIEISPKKGYGDRSKEYIFEIAKSSMPADLKLEVGQLIDFTQPNGQIAKVPVLKILPDKVVFDANHPLAGKDLVFEIEVVEILQA
jgi:peptidylprolyl isomerase